MYIHMIQIHAGHFFIVKIATVSDICHNKKVMHVYLIPILDNFLLHPGNEHFFRGLPVRSGSSTRWKSLMNHFNVHVDHKDDLVHPFHVSLK